MPVPDEYLKYKLMVVPYQQDDPDQELSIPEFRTASGALEPARTIKNPGYSIEQLKAKFGGTSGYLTDRRGDRHFLDLSPWLDLDPNKTRLRIHFVSPKVKDPRRAAQIKAEQQG